MTFDGSTGLLLLSVVLMTAHQVKKIDRTAILGRGSGENQNGKSVFELYHYHTLSIPHKNVRLPNCNSDRVSNCFVSTVAFSLESFFLVFDVECTVLLFVQPVFFLSR